MKENNQKLKLIAAVVLSSALTILVVQFLLPSHKNKEREPGIQASVDPSPVVAEPPATNTVPTVVVATNTPPDATMNPASQDAALDDPPPANELPSVTAQPEDGKTTEEDDGTIQLSFQGAQIDMVIDWLAKTTGKSIIKHPEVRSQITIMNSKKLPVRDALNLVYSALSLQGVSAIESSGSIFIVPDGKEPKLGLEFIQGSDTEIPEGRQKLVKVFQAEHTPAAELKERLTGVFSKDAVIEVDERGNKLIVTDFNDNIRLLGELIPELDTTSTSDSTIQIYPLKHLEAQEMANLLNMVLSGQAMPASAPSSNRSTRSSSRSSFPPGFPMPSSSNDGGSTAVTPSGEVRFWPDSNSNRLIVSAPKSEFSRIEELIETLDTEKPADVSVRVLPLLHVDASQLVREVAPLYRRMSGNSLKDIIEVAANERSNSLIILSSEVNFTAIRTFIKGLDNEDAQEKVIRTFALKNADAQDVAEQLRELNDSSTGNNRYVYYYSAQPSTQKTQVVADRRRNTVVVQAAPGAIDSIEKMIEALDEPVSDDSLAPRIYPLTYVNALDIEDVLNELFVDGTSSSGSGMDSYYRYLSGTSEESSKDVGRLFGKVRITSESYSNAIIITANSVESLEAVENVLKQLDVPSEAGDSTLRVALRFADSIQVSNNLNILFAKGGAPPIQGGGQQNNQQNQNNQNQNNSPIQNGFQLEEERETLAYFPWLGGQQDNSVSADGRAARPPSDLVGRVRVVPDKRSNSILLTANVHYFPQVLKLINELDAPTTQVLIEAKIIEVSTDYRDRFGVRWSPDGSQVFDAEDLDGSLQPSAGIEYVTKVFNSGILDASINLDVLIQFLKKNTDATVLASPQINVADNELGKLFVGAQIPFISNSLNTDTGGRNDNFQYKDVGIILEVTPQINNSENISLKIRAESSNIRSGETLFGGAILDTRNFRTEILVKSGETAVLGGIIQSQEGEIIRKVPLLGDIPGLGWLFKKKDKVIKNVELMVFLRPRVSRSAEEAAEILREVRAKTPRLQEWQEAQDQKQEGE